MSNDHISTDNVLSYFFNSYFKVKDADYVEGDQSKDTGHNPPSMDDKRFKFWLTGMIRTTYMVLSGDMGCTSWLQQQEANLKKRIARYNDENGNPDMDVAVTDPGVLRLMDYVNTCTQEVEAYNAMLNELCSAYKDIFREDFDLTTIELSNQRSGPVTKVSMTDEEKAQKLETLNKLLGKAA